MITIPLLITRADSVNGNATQVVGGYLNDEIHGGIGNDLRVDGGGRNTFDAVATLAIKSIAACEHSLRAKGQLGINRPLIRSINRH